MVCRLGSARPSAARWLLLLLGALLLLALACGDDSKDKLTPPAGPDYLPNDSPDNLIANVVMSLEAMDAEGYAALLYDDAQLATDGQAYADYKFYFDQSIDPHLPALWLHAQELAGMGTLLGGEEGIDAYLVTVPGVDGISLDLIAFGAWAAPPGDTVEDDSFPAGTLQRFYETNLFITLKGTYGEYINAFLVQDRLRMHCIPVQVGGETEYRLWKWRDLIDSDFAREGRGSTEESSLSTIKAIYGE